MGVERGADACEQDVGRAVGVGRIKGVVGPGDMLGEGVLHAVEDAVQLIRMVLKRGGNREEKLRAVVQPA